MCPPERAHTWVRPYMCLLIYKRNSMAGFPLHTRLTDKKPRPDGGAPRITPGPGFTSDTLQAVCLTTRMGQGEPPITRSVTLPMSSFFNPVRP